MGRISAFENVTLDGVMQAPAYDGEDRRGGFEHGGWATPYADEEAMRTASAGMAETGGVLLGRVTYEDFASVWPNQPDNPFGTFLNAIPKHVASRTLKEPLEWANSRLLDGDAIEAIGRLKETSDKNLLVLGSGELLRALLAAGLVDEVRLQIHPLVLGSGIRLLGEDGTFAAFDLVGTTTTKTGVVAATYRRGEPR
jgi:dihydrofolate reductase